MGIQSQAGSAESARVSLRDFFDLRRAAGVLAAALVGLAAGAPTVRAADIVDDPAAAFVAFELATKKHLSEKAHDSLKSDVTEIGKQVTAVTDEKLRARWKSLLGTIVTGCTEDGVQQAAIRAIGDTKDPALFRHLRPFLAQPNPKEVPPLLEDAIVATGKLAADDGALPLIALVKDSKVMSVAQAALKALGNYGGSKRMRVKILQEVTNTVEKDKPGQGKRWDNSTGESYETGRTQTGEAGVTRWGALSQSMVEALNQLTGQNCGGAEDWFLLVDKYKSNLNGLFSTK